MTFENKKRDFIKHIPSKDNNMCLMWKSPFKQYHKKNIEKKKRHTQNTV